MKSVKNLSYPLLASFLLCSQVIASPDFHNVEHGEAKVSQAGTHTEIHQATNEAILNWHHMDTSSAETVHFNQPHANSTVLNRITNGNPTQFYGKLTANGKVIIINGAGITFGPGSSVNVGGLIASTADISNQNFLKGQLHFDKPGHPDASVKNYGHIKVRDNGLVALVGPRAANHGIIEAHLGTVALGSGDTVVMDFRGDQLINFAVDESMVAAKSRTQDRSIEQSEHGQVIADGGRVYIHAAAAHKVLDNVINMKGIVQARSVSQHNGVITLHAGNGGVKVSGRMNASGRPPRQTAANKHEAKVSRGGEIRVQGDHIQIEASKFDVSGSLGGGKILIGVHPEQDQASAKTVNIASNVRLHADALDEGHGGLIQVAANESLLAHGTMSAQGGQKGGDGGVVVTSSVGQVNVDQLSVDTTAREGDLGSWQIKGQDVVIQPHYQEDRGSNSYLNAETLGANLSRANVYIESLPDKSLAGGDLQVIDKLEWNTATHLSLEAFRDVVLLDETIANHAGGSLTVMVDNKSGTGGKIDFFDRFEEKMNLDFQGGGQVRVFTSYADPSHPTLEALMAQTIGPGGEKMTVVNNEYVNVDRPSSPADSEFSMIGSPDLSPRGASQPSLNDWEHLSLSDAGSFTDEENSPRASQQSSTPFPRPASPAADYEQLSHQDLVSEQELAEWGLVHNIEEGGGGYYHHHVEATEPLTDTLVLSQQLSVSSSSSVNSILLKDLDTLSESLFGSSSELSNVELPSALPLAALVSSALILGSPASPPVVEAVVEPLPGVIAEVQPQSQPLVTIPAVEEPALPLPGSGFGKHKAASLEKKHSPHWHWVQEEEEERFLLPLASK